MSEPVHSKTQSFIVRIWYEETNGEDGVFARRGSIEHVGSKRHLSFEDLVEIIRFIEEQASIRARD